MRRRTLLKSSLALAIAPGCQNRDVTTLRIFPAKTSQTLEGFGTSLIGWKQPFADHYRTEAFADFYLRNLGASALRVELSSEAVPERTRWEDLRAEDFVLQGEGLRAANYIEAAKALTQRSNGELRVIASVWSPPGWMKVNGLNGNGNEQRQNFALPDGDFVEGQPAAETGSDFLRRNKLRRDRYEHFAKSLVEWTRLYRMHGVELYGLSPQNEPRFSHWFGSAVYRPQELADVVEAVGAMFERTGEPMPRLFAPETMTHDDLGNSSYLRSLFSGTAPGRRLHALATHGYVDGYKSDEAPGSPARFYALAKQHGKAIWMTEGGTGLHEWPTPLHHLGVQLVNSLVQGHASLITPWQAVSDVPDEHALSLLSGPTKKTAVATHFFKFLRPGMQRVGTSELGDKFPVVACKSDSKLVVVVLNRTQTTRSFQLEFEGMSFTDEARFLTDAQRDLAASSSAELSRFDAPAESIATLIFRRA